MNAQSFLFIAGFLFLLGAGIWGLTKLNETIKHNHFVRQAAIVQIVCPGNLDSAMCIQAIERLSR